LTAIILVAIFGCHGYLLSWQLNTTHGTAVLPQFCGIPKITTSFFPPQLLLVDGK
jgi:hypothetical protein